MMVREYNEADHAQLHALHRRSGFAYDLPDVSGAQFFSKRIVADHSGIAMAAFLQSTAQVFLVCDRTWRTPAWRMEAIRQLHAVCHQDARERGVAEVNAFLPPQISKQFGARLKRCGWKSYSGEEWKCFSYEIGK